MPSTTSPALSAANDWVNYPANDRASGGEAAQRQLWRRVRSMLEAQTDRSTPMGLRPSREDTVLAPLQRLCTLGLRATGLAGRGLRNALDLRLERLDLVFDDLPWQFDGYRILHLTDPHFDMLDGLGDAVRRAVAGVEADLWVMTGDYRAACRGSHEPVRAPLAAVVEAASPADGIYATLGNHDGHAMADLLQSLGVRVLANETARVWRRGAVFTITGLDDVNHYYTAAADQALLAAAPAGAAEFGLALIHSPEMADEAAAAGYALYLCGHSHGGQICLPGGRPIMTNLTRNRGFFAGLWRRGGMTGYTSRGAGVSGVPARFFSRGEVTLITLRRRASERSAAAPADTPPGSDSLAALEG